MAIEWISVDKGFPVDGEVVLICDKNDDDFELTVTTASYESDDDWSATDGAPIHDVTHWARINRP